MTAEYATDGSNPLSQGQVVNVLLVPVIVIQEEHHYHYGSIHLDIHNN